MNGYAIEHEGKGITPDGATQATKEEIDASNKRLEATELTWWTTQPERHYAYIVQREDKNTRAMGLNNGHEKWHVATTWLGTLLSHGRVAYREYHGNFGRMASVRFTATNGAEYHGRMSANSEFCRLRKCK